MRIEIFSGRATGYAERLATGVSKCKSWSMQVS